MKFTITHLLFVAVLCNILLTGYLIDEVTQKDSAQMFWNNTHSQYASGYYVPNCGFFVDTRSNNIEQIKDMITHESAHALIHQDNDSRAHFCGEE